MIGKMYRPLKILTIVDKRGFSFLHRYKSNYAKKLQFTQEIYLEYDSETKTEVVKINFPDLQIPIMTDVEKAKPRNVDVFRKLSRPLKVESKGISLSFYMAILGADKKDEKTDPDILYLEMYPTVSQNKEYLFVKAKCETPIIIVVNTPVN